MRPAIYCQLNRFLLSNGLASLKTSLKKMLVSFLCLLLANAAIGCWQHVVAQPQGQFAVIQSISCHQADNAGSLKHGSAPDHALQNSPSLAPDNSLDSTNHHSSNVQHQCALNCSLYTSPANVSPQVALTGNALLASKPFYLIANPLQAWLRDLERPPQFLS